MHPTLCNTSHPAMWWLLQSHKGTPQTAPASHASCRTAQHSRQLVLSDGSAMHPIQHNTSHPAVQRLLQSHKGTPQTAPASHASCRTAQHSRPLVALNDGSAMHPTQHSTSHPVLPAAILPPTQTARASHATCRPSQHSRRPPACSPSLWDIDPDRAAPLAVVFLAHVRMQAARKAVQPVTYRPETAAGPPNSRARTRQHERRCHMRLSSQQLQVLACGVM